MKILRKNHIGINIETNINLDNVFYIEVENFNIPKIYLIFAGRGCVEISEIDKKIILERLNFIKIEEELENISELYYLENKVCYVEKTLDRIVFYFIDGRMVGFRRRKKIV